ncbi:MAG: hypothetical protein NVSMB27_22670 [Ktedonobacteraceae bacterium]
MVHKLNRINIEIFSKSLRKLLRASGYFQKNLAKELGLHPKVFSRKLSEKGNGHLTRHELWRIITILVEWQVITTKDEVLHLLEEAEVVPESYSTQDWEALPLKKIANKGVMHSKQMENVHAHTLRHNLPAQLTRLVGREEEMEQIRQLLEQDEVRLVTLVGAGGSGKTRLALQVGDGLATMFAHGVWFVPLASVRDSSLVPQSIMQTFDIIATPGLPAMQSLIKFLRGKQLLLILDNFEQVGEAAAAVGELLISAPGLKVVVTSRVVLHLYGESEFKVQPLDIPDSRAMLDLEKIDQYSSVQLFIDRARLVMPDFRLTTENAATIGQICARVDGLPLGLELAAARIKVLPPAQLLERLSTARLSVLVGGARNLPDRQQTLRNTIIWSYGLLSSAEQAWFARMGVFSGGWTLEATEAMMQAVVASQHLADASVTEPTLDLLERLVDNSLLVRSPVMDGQLRFTLLETLREYALEQLNTHGELERLKDWHACYYLGVVEEAEIGLKGAQQLVWQARLVAEQDNIRAALEWSLQRARAGMTMSGPMYHRCRSTRGVKGAARNETMLLETVTSQKICAVEVCLRLPAALRAYWEWQGHLVEGRVWLEAALAIALEEGVGGSTLAARAKALSEAARLVCLQNEQDRAVTLAEESIALWRQLDDPKGLANALFHRGWPAFPLGEFELIKSVYRDALQLLSATDELWLRGQLLFYRGTASGFTGDFGQMRSYYAQSRELFGQVGDRCAIADVLKDQGGMAILEGNYHEAISDLVESIVLSHKLGHKQFVGTGLGLLGFAVGMRGEPDPVSASLQAAKLWSAANSIQQAVGLHSWLGNLARVQEMIFQIRARVDDEDWKTAWRAGRSLTEEQAIQAAMASQHDSIFSTIT